MKKILKIIICIFFIIFISICYMVYIDNKYNERIISNIISKTMIDSVIYYNKYDKYFIVMDNKYLYLLDNKYREIFKVDKIKIYDNINNYDIIYKNDLFMYMKDYYKNDKLIYEYYDLYTYELIDKVVLGG